MKSDTQNLTPLFTPALKGEGTVALKAPFRGLGVASDDPTQKGAATLTLSWAPLKGESTLVLRRSETRALNGNKTPALKGEGTVALKAPFRGLGVASDDQSLLGDLCALYTNPITK